ncbi:MAG: MBL fold metallo-hydrolase RNA specificity domain-containing protein [Bacteroidia bacterium]
MDKSAPLTISFLGATGTVTGSKFLIEAGENKILVDCGLFQGLKELRQRNWDKLPFDVPSLSCVLLTHGHLDHSGYLPLLVKQGFNGKIFATRPTIEIAKLILSDSAQIQEEDAERANTFHYSRHKPAKPLYTLREAEKVFPLFSPTPLDQWIELFPEILFRFRYNGHIIGSAFIELKINNRLIVFSGDVGRRNDPLLLAPEKPERADVLIIESTYGNRVHAADTEQLLADAINKAAEKNGTIIIPGFAVERSQSLMYYLWKLRNEKRIPLLPVYMDSPMGSSVLGIFQRNLLWHKLSAEECVQMCKDIKIIREVKETEALIADKSPKIIIAASGMVSGGRVLTYLEHYLGRQDATILLAGYQGEGTRGRALLEGAKELKIHGKLWPVKAAVALIEGLSAHADAEELISWMSALDPQPENIFIVHGEKEAAEELKARLKIAYNCNALIPKMNEHFHLDK